jgi:hypothetical protein
MFDLPTVGGGTWFVDEEAVATGDVHVERHAGSSAA